MSQSETVQVNAVAPNRNTVRDVINRSAESESNLGELVMWSITGFRDTVDGVRAKVSQAGLDPSLVGNVRNKTAFLKAVREIANQTRARVVDGPDNKAVCVRVIAYTTVDPLDLNVSVQTSVKAVLIKGTGAVEFRDMAGNKLDTTLLGPVETEISARFEYWKQNVDSDQFRDVVLDLLKHYCDYITVRDRGGAYFVPKACRTELAKIKALFGLYEGADLLALGVPDTENERRFMGGAFMSDIEAELNALEDRMAALKASPSDRSLKALVEEFNRLQGKQDNYAFLIQGKSERVEIGRAHV